MKDNKMIIVLKCLVVCMCVCVSVSVCTGIYKGQPKVLFLRYFLALFLKTRFLAIVGVTSLARLSGCLPQRHSGLCLPGTKTTHAHHNDYHFMYVLKLKLRASCLMVVNPLPAVPSSQPLLLSCELFHLSAY